MSDEKKSGLHIDSDWKAEAAKEKERLAEQERAAAEANRDMPGGGGPAGFFDIINLLAMQAAVGIGGFQGPGGERIPPNLASAKHHIDLLEVLEQKTVNNLTDDEKRVLNQVLYELRMRYVQIVSAATGVSAGGA